MISYSLTVDSLARSKDSILAHVGRGSGHVDEALASGFGFRSFAALLAALRDAKSLAVVFDPDAFAHRFTSLGHPGGDGLRSAGIRAVCHGFENWVDEDLEDGSPEDVKTAIGAMAVQQARRTLVATDGKLASIVTRRQVVTPVLEYAGGPSRKRIVLPASALGTVDEMVVTLGTLYGIWVPQEARRISPEALRLASDLYRSDAETTPSRIAGYGVSCDTPSGIMSCLAIAADDPRGYGDLDSLQTGLYLARKVADLGSNDLLNARESLAAMARRRFPTLVYGVVLQEIYAGQGFIPATNAKILMRAKGWSKSWGPENALRFVRRRETALPGKPVVDGSGHVLSQESLARAEKLSSGIPHDKCLALFAGGDVWFIRQDGRQATAQAATWDGQTGWTADGMRFDDEAALFRHLRGRLADMLPGLPFLGMNALALHAMSSVERPGTFHHTGYYRARGVVELGMVGLT
jgi:hypothetical protein